MATARACLAMLACSALLAIHCQPAAAAATALPKHEQPRVAIDTGSMKLTATASRDVLLQKAGGGTVSTLAGAKRTVHAVETLERLALLRTIRAVVDDLSAATAARGADTLASIGRLNSLSAEVDTAVSSAFDTMAPMSVKAREAIADFGGSSVGDHSLGVVTALKASWLCDHRPGTPCTKALCRTGKRDGFAPAIVGYGRNLIPWQDGEWMANGLGGWEYFDPLYKCRIDYDLGELLGGDPNPATLLVPAKVELVQNYSVINKLTCDLTGTQLDQAIGDLDITGMDLTVSLAEGSTMDVYNNRDQWGYTILYGLKKRDGTLLGDKVPITAPGQGSNVRFSAPAGTCDPGGRCAIRGNNNDHRNNDFATLECVSKDAYRHTRCCSDTEIKDGRTKYLNQYTSRYTGTTGTCKDKFPQRQVYAESMCDASYKIAPYQSDGSMTWAASEAVCQDTGGRQCTIHELNWQCTRGSGCSYDGKQIWSGSYCTPGDINACKAASGKP